MSSSSLPTSKPLFRLLLQLTDQQNLRAGTSLHAHILKTGRCADIFLANSVVNFYAKCHNLAAATLAFDDMNSRDVVSWNSLINGYSHTGPQGSSAVLALFRRMRAEGGVDVIPNPFTFAGVFTAASHAPDMGGCGKEAHCVAVKTGNYGDVFVGSSLVNFYSKAGLVSDARKVFDRMPERNSVSWTAMLSGYAGEKCGVEALGLFRIMLEEGECRPNEFVFTSILSALSLPGFVELARQIHGLAIRNGLSTFGSVENSLVTLYSKCECLDDAVLMFLSSGNKDTITWSAMITGYAQNNESEKALTLFSQMQSEGIRPTEFTLVGVLNACSDLMSLVKGIQAHGYVLKLGFELQLYIKSALVDMYAKCGDVEDARKGFDQLHEEVDIVLWSTMIGGYVKNGEHEEALTMYGRMEREGISPNDLTMACVLRGCAGLAALEQGKQIHAHALKYGFTFGPPLGSALSTMYAKCGNLEDCSCAFREMPQRDVVAWNSIISGFSQNGHGKDAMDLFEEMKLEGAKPDHVTFVNLLFACSHMGLVERGWGYFKSIRDDYGLVPRVEHYACMVDILTRAGMFQEAKDFIESVPLDHGLSLWRIVLGSCRSYKDFHIGAYAGERLLELGSRDSSAYILLSNIYAAQRKWHDMERVRRIMKLRQIIKEPGCSWIELKNRVHVFVVGEQLHPEIKDIYSEVRQLRLHMKDEGYHPDSELHSHDNVESDIGSYIEEELSPVASIVS